MVGARKYPTRSPIIRPEKAYINIFPIFFLLIRAIRAAMMAKRPAEAAAMETAKKLHGVAPKMPRSKFSEPAVAQKPIKRSTGSFTREVTDELTDEITKASVSVLEDNLDQSKRLFRNIADKLGTGEINPVALRQTLSKHNMSPQEFAEEYLKTISSSGRRLAYHSRVAKELQFVFKDNPEVVRMFKKAYDDYTPTAVDKFMGLWGRVENKRRAMLVGQVATAMRNAWSQMGRISLSTFDEAMQGVSKAIFSAGQFKEGIEDVGRSLNTLVAGLKRMSPKGRRRLEQILDENSDIISSMRLFSQPVHEVTLGGHIANITNTLNRAQEYYFRRLAFEAKLRTLLGRKGLDFNTINPKHIPDGFIEESVNYALEMTFAAAPKGKAAAKMIKAFNDFPILYTIQPFPRFNFANALPFLFDHSPLGYLNAVKPSTLKALANGHPEQFAKAASRATIGTIMLDSAMRIRQSKYAGPRWYEIKVGEKEDGSARIIDIRAFAPFSTYFFLAEALVNPSSLKPSDYTNAFVGLSRVAGTGLVFTDWMRAASGESFKKQTMNFAGQYLASFLTPARTIQDIYGAFDSEEMFVRDWRESPIVASIMSNLPKLSQRVPKRFSAATGKPMRRAEEFTFGGRTSIPGGVVRQLTGLSKRTKTKLESEIDTTGLPWASIVPRTGIAQADRLMAKYMGPVAERIGMEVVNSDRYKKSPVELKRLQLAAVFKTAKQYAQIKLARSHPDLVFKISFERQADDIEELIKKQGLDTEKIEEQLKQQRK